MIALGPARWYGRLAGSKLPFAKVPAEVAKALAEWVDTVVEDPDGLFNGARLLLFRDVLGLHELRLPRKPIGGLRVVRNLRRWKQRVFPAGFPFLVPVSG